MTKEQIKRTIIDREKTATRVMVKWNNCLLFKWQFLMLKDIGAISDKGIICDYPIIRVNSSHSSDSDIYDAGGDEHTTRNELKNLISKGKRAEIEYVPMTYHNYIQAREELDKLNVFESQAFKAEVEMPAEVNA